MLRATFSQPPRRSLRATLPVVVVVVEVIDYQRRIIKSSSRAEETREEVKGTRMGRRENFSSISRARLGLRRRWSHPDGEHRAY